MHLLVTGGTGFIGHALCTALAQGGHRVTVLTRDRGHASRRLPGVTAIEAPEQVDAVDAVVNLAGEPLAAGRWTARRKQAFRESRIGTTRRLYDWIARLPEAQRPRCLVSGSAVGYYGDRGDTVLSEDASRGSDFSAQLCRDWESAALDLATLGPRVSLLRTGIVLARDGGSLQRMLPPFRLGAGGPFGDGRHWMSWIHCDDLVALIVWLLDRGGEGAYNGTAPAPVTNAEFARTLGEAVHRPTLLRLPAVALRLGFGEMADLLLVSQRVIPQRAVQEGFRFRYPELRQALAAILPRP